MSETAQPLPKRAIREALARGAYERGEVRIADPDVRGYTWLVASPQGVFAVAPDNAKTAIYGWFFGICRHHDTIFLFENCGPRGGTIPMGRLVRLELASGRLATPTVLATGLHGNCHQIAVIDRLICVVDTPNQAILRFTLDGSPVDVQRPFPPAPPNDRTGAYLHLNAIAQIGDRIAMMLHNGKAIPEKPSELAWLNRDWTIQERQPLPGHSCHDILEDERGVLWHTASMSGEIIGSDGTRVKITDEMMTRGLAITSDATIVGVSRFGPRHIRDTLRGGGVVILDRDFSRRAEITLRGAPTDIMAL
jgi:hypothetical protein